MHTLLANSGTIVIILKLKYYQFEHPKCQSFNLTLSYCYSFNSALWIRFSFNCPVIFSLIDQFHAVENNSNRSELYGERLNESMYELEIGFASNIGTVTSQLLKHNVFLVMVTLSRFRNMETRKKQIHEVVDFHSQVTYDPRRLKNAIHGQIECNKDI